MLHLALLLPLLASAAEDPIRIPDGGSAPFLGREALGEGWERVELSTGSWVELYRSRSETPAEGESVPAVVFLHGDGALPLHYRSLVASAAEAVGASVALPKSREDGGWGFAGDSQALAESLALLRSEGVDPRQVGIAGHDGGGAYAYLQAYSATARFSGVLSLGAPFRPVAALPEGYIPPIRMYYGDLDRDYGPSGSRRLRDQWEDLGVDSEIVVRENRGKNDLALEDMIEGFQFLVDQRVPDEDAVGGVCAEDSQVLCLYDGRFAVEVDWNLGPETVGRGQVALQSERSGLFWFFTPTNWEVIVKVLDGCALNSHFWVFGAATTTVGFEVRVTDLWTATTAVYGNALGQSAAAINDIAALACP